MAFGNSAAEIAEYKKFAAAMETQYGIPPGLLQWQIGAESSWNPNARNPNSTATGIAQFTNPTAAWRGVDQLDPYSSIQGAASYMSYLKRITGTWEKALENYGTTHDNPTKAAQAAQILAQNNAMANPDTILYSESGNVSIYVPRPEIGIGGSMGGSGKVGGDTSAGGAQADGSTYGQESGENAGLSIFNSDFMGWLKTLLGSAPLIILGIALILIALWSVWSEKK